MMARLYKYRSGIIACRRLNLFISGLWGCQSMRHSMKTFSPASGQTSTSSVVWYGYSLHTLRTLFLVGYARTLSG